MKSVLLLREAAGLVVLRDHEDVAVRTAERSLHRHAVAVAYAVGDVGRRIEEVGVRAAQDLLPVLLHRFELLHNRLAGAHLVLVVGERRAQGDFVAQGDLEQEQLHGQSVVGQKCHLQHVHAVGQVVGPVALHVSHIPVRSVDDALSPGRLGGRVELGVFVESIRIVARSKQPHAQQHSDHISVCFHRFIVLCILDNPANNPDYSV